MANIFRTGLGKASHRFLPPSQKPCIIAGAIFEDCPGFQANSDGDVVFYALCNAISSLISFDVLTHIAEELLSKEGITDSEVYVKEAVKMLHAKKQKITHVAISLEAKKPRFQEKIDAMKTNIARLLHIEKEAVGITAISGDGLSDYACGYGVGCLALVSTCE